MGQTGSIVAAPPRNSGDVTVRAPPGGATGPRIAVSSDPVANPLAGVEWREECAQTACKPGSVLARIGRWMAIRLGRPLPDASRDLPGRRRGNPPAGGPKAPAGRPYSVLLPVGFTVPSPSPGTRCALTAPFHPCQPRRSGTGGLLSVALSLGLPPPGVTRHRVSMEPGLSSPRKVSPSRKAAIRPSGASYI